MTSTKVKTTEVEIETTLFKSIVKALSYHASTDKQRPLLTTIHFGKVAMVATNSYTLAVWEPTKFWKIGEPFQIEAKELLNGIKDMKSPNIILSVTNGTWLVKESSVHGAKRAGGSTTEGEFPIWKPLIPSDINNKFEPTGFDPALLRNICDASKSINKDSTLKVAVWQTPAKPMLFKTETIDGVLTQLIMPQRLTNKK